MSRVTFLLLLFSKVFLSQNLLHYDSLRTSLLNEKNDIKKLEIIKQLLSYKRKNNYTITYSEADSIVEMIEKKHLDTTTQYLDILSTLNKYFYNNEDYTRANKYVYKILIFHKKKSNILNIIIVLCGISKNYSFLHLFDMSYKTILEAESYLNESNLDKKSYLSIRQIIYDTYATLYFEKEDYSKCLEYAIKCYNISKEINDTSYICLSLNTLAICYSELKQYQKALDILFENIKMEKNKKQISFMDISIDLYNIANNYIKLKELNKAIQYLDSSIYYYNRASTNNNNFLSEYYYLYMEIYILKGNIDKALEFRDKFFQIKDSLNAQNLKEELAKQSTIYQLEAKELEKQKLLAEKRQQQYVIYGSVFALILISLFALFIFNSYKQKQKANLELERKNNIIEIQKKLVEEQNKNITDSIHYASRIQKALLTTDEYLNQHLKNIISDFFILYIPKDIVSGDFYWSIQKENYLYLVIGDSTGHGVPGAFMSLLNINFLNESIVEKNITDTGKIFDYVKKQLMIHLHGEKDGMDATIIRFDLNNINHIQYSAANHQPILITHQKEFIKCQYNKQPIGVDEINNSSFESFELTMQKGDTLYLFTDGYADQFGGEKDKKLQRSNFYRIIQQYSSLNATEQKEFLKKIFIEWKGARDQTDDVCVAGLFF
ncbi:MAG: SpoIIE family protein phosphatase [Bacteroidota bacterium]